MKEVNCCVCGTDKSIPLWSHADDRFLLKLDKRDRVRVCCCISCGLAYASPRLSEDELTELYTRSYRDAGGVPADHLSSKERQSRERIEWLAGRYTQPQGVAVPRILEIGCSEGVLLRQLRDERGWSVAGAEPFEPYARHGIREWNLEVGVSFFESRRFAREFDVVAFIHVIEHIPDPLDFLHEVSRVLKKGGHIFFETPNLRAPKVGRIGPALFAAPHLAIYSPRSIERLLRRAGFELLHVEANLNLRVLARWTGATPEAQTAATACGPVDGVRHALWMSCLYRWWWLREQALFKRRGAAAFLVRNARALLGAKGYERFRHLYHRR